MSKFKEWEDKAYDTIHFRESEPAPDPDADDVLIDDDEEDGEDQFLAEYDIASGMLDGLSVLDDENLRKLYSKRSDLPE
jgi:hypothetical protein